MEWRELAFPVGFDTDQAAAFARLLATRPVYGLFRQPDPLVIETTGTPAGLRWLVGMTGREAAALVPDLNAQLPGVAAEPAERRLPVLRGAVELRLADRIHPLRTDVADAVAAALLTAIADVAEGEAVVLSWVVGPTLARPAYERGDAAGLLGPPLESDEARAVRAKLAEPVLGVAGRIGIRAASPERGVWLLQRVAGALELARAAGVGFVVRNVGGFRAAKHLAQHHGPLFDWPCPLNAPELAAVSGWPIGTPYVEGVVYRGHRQLPPPAESWVPDATAAAVPPGRYRIVGRATYPGRAGYLHLTIDDALRHLHVVGPTGSGKSVLLAHLIDADITAGRSVVVIEPKADLIAAVLDRIPEDRTGDVVLIDPADDAYAVGLDVLGGAAPEVAADRLTHVLGRLFREAWGPRTGQVVYAAAAALARAGGALVDLPALLTDARYRRRVLEAAPDPAGTGPFWEWFDRQTHQQQAAAVGPALSRLDAFTGRAAIRGVIGQTAPRFHLSDVFSNRRVVLVNLARGLIGPEAARLLGALVLNALWQATQAQTAIPAERRRPVLVYVDEFQDYLSGVALDFGDLLAQARGLGVGLTVAHQGLYQLDPATLGGVLTNARSRVVFQQTAPDEARDLAAALGADLTPADLAALAPYHAYAALVAGGATGPPASIATLPPLPGQGIAAAVRQTSRAQWARPRAEVDAAILARRQPTPAADRLGGRRPRDAP